MNRERPGLPARLRWALAAAGLNVPQLAEKSGISESALKKWLAEASRPRASNLLPVASALEVSVGWLMGQTEVGGPDREALQEAKDAEVSALISRSVPYMKAARAAAERARADDEDAAEEARQSGRAPPNLLWGRVDIGRLDIAFRDALARTGFDPAAIGDTKALLLLTILLHDASLKSDQAVRSVTPENIGG